MILRSYKTTISKLLFVNFVLESGRFVNPTTNDMMILYYCLITKVV
jgi:hypothetical protein